ncbi:ABC transporter permease (plasmid) [Rhodococcus globerulus]|uniref:ABC transporter permease n=1 Tax=Rhodococcus globerulus TaxID=33008 RepID=UPI0039E7F176
MSWVRFLAVRLAVAVAVLAGLSALVFAATDVLPGDAVGVIAGPDATAAERDQIRSSLHLDGSALERYRSWMSAVVHGDLGHAYIGGGPVTSIIAQRLPASALLAGLTIPLVIVCALTAGLIAGTRAGGRADRVLSTLSLIAVGIPEFLVATLMMLAFSRWLGWLPAVSLVPLGESVASNPSVMVLPVLSMAVVGTAVAFRLLRGSIIDVCASPYIEAAKLAGIGDMRRALRHVLPNSVGPFISAVAIISAGLVGGAVVVETLFGYPGIGRELQRAVATRDVPVVQGVTLLLSALSLGILLLGDIAARLLDPASRRAS